MDSVQLLTLFFLLFCLCSVFPIPVFVSCGLTVESLFSRWLGSDVESFVRYHRRRLVATIMFHSSLPLVYVLLRLYLDPKLDVLGSLGWQCLFLGSVTMVMLSAMFMYSWTREGWQLHPVTAMLRPFTGEHQGIDDVIRDIDRDYRSPDKLILQTDPTRQVIVTPSWIIATGCYSLHIASQHDVQLQVLSADNHEVAVEARGGVQFLNILVTSDNPSVKDFTIRINSANLKTLQDMITRPIRILPNITVQCTLTDRFLVAFKDQVRLNPTVNLTSQEDEPCWGCSVKQPDVKLVKTCSDSPATAANPCSPCSCKPIWCIDCMGRWFASRQDKENPGRWMSAKCSCPLCRATFCVLDVCSLVSTPADTQ